MDKIIIADAGPLIAFAGINRLDIIQDLFNTVWLTSGVIQEVTRKHGKDSEHILSALSEGWLIEHKIQLDEAGFPRSLGQGEVESIDWAKQLTRQGVDSLIILDDRLARKYALELQLNIVGSVRLLDIAEQKGLIDNAEATIKLISAKGYRISIDILKLIRKHY